MPIIPGGDNQSRCLVNTTREHQQATSPPSVALVHLTRIVWEVFDAGELLTIPTREKLHVVLPATRVTFSLGMYDVDQDCASSYCGFYDIARDQSQQIRFCTPHNICIPYVNLSSQFPMGGSAQQMKIARVEQSTGLRAGCVVSL